MRGLTFKTKQRNRERSIILKMGFSCHFEPFAQRRGVSCLATKFARGYPPDCIGTRNYRRTGGGGSYFPRQGCASYFCVRPRALVSPPYESLSHKPSLLAHTVVLRPDCGRILYINMRDRAKYGVYSNDCILTSTL